MTKEIEIMSVNEAGARKEASANATYAKEPPDKRMFFCAAALAFVVLALLIAIVAVSGVSLREIGREHHHHDKNYWHEPSLPGVLPGKSRPKIILAQDIDYPPYAYLGSATEDFDVAGFGHDVALGLMEVCDNDTLLRMCICLTHPATL
jgi:hypothetical protein